MPAPQPVMLVVGGPSGSGKSRMFPVADSGYAAFNVDDRCRDLNGGSYVATPPATRAQAQRECEQFVMAQIAARTSFCEFRRGRLTNDEVTLPAWLRRAIGR